MKKVVKKFSGGQLNEMCLKVKMSDRKELLFIRLREQQGPSG